MHAVLRTRLSEVLHRAAVGVAVYHADGSDQSVHPQVLEVRACVALAVSALAARSSCSGTTPAVRGRSRPLAGTCARSCLLESRRPSRAAAWLTSATIGPTGSGKRCRGAVIALICRESAASLAGLASVAGSAVRDTSRIPPCGSGTQKVEALPPVPDIDHLGLRRMERQLQSGPG